MQSLRTLRNQSLTLLRNEILLGKLLNLFQLIRCSKIDLTKSISLLQSEIQVTQVSVMSKEFIMLGFSIRCPRRKALYDCE